MVLETKKLYSDQLYIAFYYEYLSVQMVAVNQPHIKNEMNNIHLPVEQNVEHLKKPVGLQDHKC
jgi:hypothetical protein